MAAPRCTMLAEVMLHDRDTLSHAEKRNGSDQWAVRAGSSKLGEGRAACAAHVHPLASQGRRRPGCNMMIVVRGGADTCMAGLVAVLDREDTAGTTAAPPRCGRSKIHSMYPVQRSVRSATGAAPLLEDEASDKLLLDSRTPPRGRRATVTRRKLCGGVLRALWRPP